MTNKKEQATKKTYFNAERRSRIFPSVLLVVFLNVMLFVVAPFEIFCNNIGEFYFSATDFVFFTLGIAFIFSALSFLLLFLIPEKVYHFVYPFFLGVFFMFFLQSNYLNIGLDSLGGDDMKDFSAGTYVWNTAVWVIGIALFVFLFQVFKKKELTKTIALILTITLSMPQAINFSVLAMTTEDAFGSAIDRKFDGDDFGEPRFITNKNLTTVGSSRNVIVFCVDRMDGKLYTEPAMQTYPETFDKFDGFTYYEDATSLYGNTFPAIGYMLSQIEYDNKNHKDWFDKVYNQNSTLSVLHENGYDINLFAEYYYDYYDARQMPDYIDNAVETSRESLKLVIKNPQKFNRSMMQMALYRTLPFALKNLAGNIDSATCNAYAQYVSDDLQGYSEFKADTKGIYKQIKAKQNEFSTTGEKNFTFIHMAGCHTAGLDENFETSKKHKKDYVLSARNSMEIIASYLESMKAISPELYKDATIIILGDHGKIKNHSKEIKDSMLTSLFVKRSGESGTPLKKSKAPVSHDNLWATIFESEGIAYENEAWAQSIFAVQEAYEKGFPCPPRRFIWNMRTPNIASYYSITYEIVGEARVWKNWREVGRVKINHALFAQGLAE